MEEENKQQKTIEINTKEKAQEIIKEISRIQYSRLKGRVLGIIERTFEKVKEEDKEKIDERKRSIIFTLKHISNDGAKVLEQIEKYIV